MFRIRVCRSLDGRRCPAVWFRGEVVQQAGRGLEEKENVLHCVALNGTSWWVQGPGQIGKEEEAMGDREDGAFGASWKSTMQGGVSRGEFLAHGEMNRELLCTEGVMRLNHKNSTPAYRKSNVSIHSDCLG